MNLLKSLCAVVLLLLPVEALAAGKSVTSYTYYTVDGSSAGQILLSLTRKGPRLGGIKAFGTTHAKFAQNGRMLSNGKNCKVDRLSFSGRYVIRLPRHRAENRIAGASVGAWNQFENYVRVHENQHVVIWNQCIGELERAARSVTAKNCNGVERKIAQVAERIRNQCQKRHEQFDARAQQQLPSLPLIRQALSQGIVKIRTPRKR